MFKTAKLRAVLLIALVSAFAWGLTVALLNIGVELYSGRRLTLAAFTDPFLMYAGFGFLSGALFAVAIALHGTAGGHHQLTRVRAASFGALGGAVMFLGVWIGILGRPFVDLFDAALAPATLFTLIGATTGLAIRATANHARLPSGPEATRTLPP